MENNNLFSKEELRERVFALKDGKKPYADFTSTYVDELLDEMFPEHKSVVFGVDRVNALVKMTLQMAKDAGNDGFKRADLFVALEHSLPSTKDTNSKKRYLGHLLDKLRSEGLLDYTNNCWFITEKGLEQM